MQRFNDVENNPEHCILLIKDDVFCSLDINLEYWNFILALQDQDITSCCAVSTWAWVLPLNFVEVFCLCGVAVAQLVEALSYKPEVRGFDYRWGHWGFSLTHSFRPHCGPGSIELLTEMSTRGIFCEVKVAVAQGWQPGHLHVPID